MKSEYLLLLCAVLIVPLIYSFSARLGFYRTPGALFRTLAIICGAYWIWDAVATARGHWRFHPRFILGVTIGNLPVEELLFFPVIAFVAIFTWEVVKFYSGGEK